MNLHLLLFDKWSKRGVTQIQFWIRRIWVFFALRQFQDFSLTSVSRAMCQLTTVQMPWEVWTHLCTLFQFRRKRKLLNNGLRNFFLCVLFSISVCSVFIEWINSGMFLFGARFLFTDSKEFWKKNSFEYKCFCQQINVCNFKKFNSNVYTNLHVSHLINVPLWCAHWLTVFFVNYINFTRHRKSASCGRERAIKSKSGMMIQRMVQSQFIGRTGKHPNEHAQK